MMIKLPVVLNYDYEQVVGSLEIDEDVLPSSPNFVFSIGYKLGNDLKTELTCVSLQYDKHYIEYLKSAGKL